MRTHNSRPLPGAAGAKLNLDSLSMASHADTSFQPTSCLAAGLAYAGQDIAVFPLTANKKPLRLCAECQRSEGCPGRHDCRCPVDTCHGFYAATTDAATVRRWWTDHPDWQLGIRTGAVSNLVALDVDVDKGGLDSLIELERQGFDITGTSVQLSGSGRSFHLLYAHPGHRVPNTQGRLGRGLDVRGDGGYVVGGPSLHPRTGQPYSLLGDLRRLPTWTEVPQPPVIGSAAPRSSSGRQRSRSKKGDRLTPNRLEALINLAQAAPEGERRSTLFWAACRLGECSGGHKVLVRAAERLLDAGMASGLGRAEAYATLFDGVRVGRRSC